MHQTNKSDEHRASVDTGTRHPGTEPISSPTGRQTTKESSDHDQEKPAPSGQYSGSHGCRAAADRRLRGLIGRSIIVIRRQLTERRILSLQLVQRRTLQLGK